MNYKQAMSHAMIVRAINRTDRQGQIASAVLATISAEAPRKPWDKDSAKSHAKLNDVGILMEGVRDDDADMPWLTDAVMRVLWNAVNRNLPRG